MLWVHSHKSLPWKSMLSSKLTVTLRSVLVWYATFDDYPMSDAYNQSDDFYQSDTTGLQNGPKIRVAGCHDNRFSTDAEPIDDNFKISPGNLQTNFQLGWHTLIPFHCFDVTVCVWKSSSPTLTGKRVTKVKGGKYMHWV